MISNLQIDIIAHLQIKIHAGEYDYKQLNFVCVDK